MRLLILADLHLDEITDVELLHMLGEAIESAGRGADALIIAGDLTEFAVARWQGAIRWLGRHYPTKQTIIIPGNHDYYGGHLSMMDKDLDQICKAEGASFGQCRRLDMGNTRILMTTLWTDMRLFEMNGEDAVEQSMWDAQVMMPDYGFGAILVDDPEIPLLPEHTVALHMKQKAWLTAELARSWKGKTIVVTHHAPSAMVGGTISPLSPCFVSNLDEVIERYRPDAWIFGHTHRPAELRMPGGTLLRNVSLGYEHELLPSSIADRVRAGVIDL